MAKGLTKRQEEILDFIVEGVRDEGFPPTLKEIAGRFGLASPNAARDHVLALERKGFLKRTGVKSRALSLSPSLRAVAAAAPRGWPLLGVVPAGTPVLAEENFEGYVDLNELFGRGEGTFLLKISGESMSGHQRRRPRRRAPPGADRLGGDRRGLCLRGGDREAPLPRGRELAPAAGEPGARPDQGLGRGPRFQGRG